MSNSVRKRNQEKSGDPPPPTFSETLSRAFTSEAKWTDKVFMQIYVINIDNN
jgi:hypothetical protein